MTPRHALAAALVLALAGPAAATTREQLEPSVARDLKRHQIRVDTDTLRTGQINALYSLFHSNRSHSEKRAMARSIVGGRNSLRGVLLGDR
ncbi:MAG: hypothetical protein AAFQ79_03780 [Pseudomonadota bacterium]